MPPRKRISKVDDDFIDDELIEPATKRAKASKAKNNEDKPISSTPSTKKQIDGEGNPYWEGIMLSVDQFNALMTVLPQLHATLAKEAGSEIVVPAFGGTAENASTENRNSRFEEDKEMKHEEEEEEMPKAKVKKDTKRDEPRVKQEAVDGDDESEVKTEMDDRDL